MSVAVCVHRYRPSNPRYRAAAPLLEACASRGVTASLVAGAWDAPVPGGVDTVTMPALLGGRRAGPRAYRRWAAGVLRRTRPACAFGFDPVPGLDVYCGERHEKDACGDGNDGLVLAGPDLLPGLASGPPMVEAGDVRERLGFDGEDIVLVMFGGDLVARGLERLLVATSKLPEASRRRVRLLAVGDLSPAFVKAVRVLGLDGQVHLTQVQPARALAAGDVLVDLPYGVGSNAWVFDALAAGVPILTTEDVAESALVAEADAGLVLASPFVQAQCNSALVRMAGAVATGAPEWCGWQERGRAFAGQPRHYGQTSQLMGLVEDCLRAAPGRNRPDTASGRRLGRGIARLRA